MAVPRLSTRQSQARVRALKAKGCKVKKVRLPNGDIAVLKKCPQLANNPGDTFRPYGDMTEAQLRDVVVETLGDWLQMPTYVPGPGLKALLKDAGWARGAINNYADDCARWRWANRLVLYDQARDQADTASEAKLRAYWKAGLVTEQPSKSCGDTVRWDVGVPDYYFSGTKKVGYSYQANPIGATVAVVAAALGLVGAFLWWGNRKKPAEGTPTELPPLTPAPGPSTTPSTTPSTQPSTPAPGPSTSPSKPVPQCSVTQGKLASWALERGYTGWYQAGGAPPPFDSLPEAVKQTAKSAGLAQFVLVSGTTFYTYTSGSPQVSAAKKTDFCNWSAGK